MAQNLHYDNTIATTVDESNNVNGGHSSESSLMFDSDMSSNCGSINANAHDDRNSDTTIETDGAEEMDIDINEDEDNLSDLSNSLGSTNGDLTSEMDTETENEEHTISFSNVTTEDEDVDHNNTQLSNHVDNEDGRSIGESNASEVHFQSVSTSDSYANYSESHVDTTAISELLMGNAGEKSIECLAVELLDQLKKAQEEGHAGHLIYEWNQDLNISSALRSTEELIEELRCDDKLNNICVGSIASAAQTTHPREFFKFSFVREVMTLPFHIGSLYHMYNRGQIDVLSEIIFPCEEDYLDALLQDLYFLRQLYFNCDKKIFCWTQQMNLKIVLTEILRLLYVPALISDDNIRSEFIEQFILLQQGFQYIVTYFKKRRELRKDFIGILDVLSHRETTPHMSRLSPWESLLGIYTAKEHDCNHGCNLWRKPNTCLLTPVAIRILAFNEYPIFELSQWIDKEHPDKPPSAELPWTMYLDPTRTLMNRRESQPPFRSFICEMPNCLKQIDFIDMRRNYTDNMNHSNHFFGLLRDGPPDYEIFPSRVLIDYHIIAEE